MDSIELIVSQSTNDFSLQKLSPNDLNATKVEVNGAGKRLDAFCYTFLQELYSTSNLSEKVSLTTLSRENFISLPLESFIQVNGVNKKKGYKFRVGDKIKINLSKFNELIAIKIEKDIAKEQIIAEKGILDIIEESTDYTIINKQHGVVVHPGAGNWNGTIANYYKGYLEGKGEFDPELKRAGIVHRLDKGVGGLMILAKNRSFQLKLKNAFENKEVVKVYKASVRKVNTTLSTPFYESLEGQPFNEAFNDATQSIESLPASARVGGYIERSAANRFRMEFKHGEEVELSGKLAVSYLFPIQGGNEVLIRIVTGRMHQIRATFKELGYVINGDQLYGDKNAKDSNSISLESIYLKFPKLGIAGRLIK